ncbi:hypothetical protein ED312_20130, partial [Sinomicrobium pectinilyticum]
ITYTDEDGIATTIDINSIVDDETVTNLVDNGDGTITYTNEEGIAQTVDMASIIAANETNTILALTDGELIYTNEGNDNPNIPLISTDADNAITVGTDGSLFTDTSALTVEPWLVQGTTDKATENDQDIYQMGKVGIGTDDMLGTENPDVALAVNGAILTTSAIYADYVFEDYFEGFSELNKDYTFKSLKEVEDFINRNRHLPGITKIDALCKNQKGEYVINPSELSVQLLEKVEELYLHTIEQQKALEGKDREIKRLRQRQEDKDHEIERLQQQQEAMEERLSRLEKLFKE